MQEKNIEKEILSAVLQLMIFDIIWFHYDIYEESIRVLVLDLDSHYGDKWWKTAVLTYIKSAVFLSPFLLIS